MNSIKGWQFAIQNLLGSGLQSSSDAPSSPPRSAADAVETLNSDFGNMNLEEKSEEKDTPDVSTRMVDNVKTSDGCDRDLTATEGEVNSDDGKLAPLSEDRPEEEVVATGRDQDLTETEGKVNSDDGKLEPLSEDRPEEKVVVTGWDEDLTETEGKVNPDDGKLELLSVYRPDVKVVATGWDEDLTETEGKVNPDDGKLELLSVYRPDEKVVATGWDEELTETEGKVNPDDGKFELLSVYRPDEKVVATGWDEDLTEIEGKVNSDDKKLVLLSENWPEEKVVATGWGWDDEITAPEVTERFGKNLESYHEVKAEGWGWDDETVGTEDKTKTEEESKPWKDSKEQRRSPPQFPSRPDEPDCTHYMRTGTCRYGLNCKFNHPPSRLRSKMRFRKPPESLQNSGNGNQKEFFSGWSGQAESKVVELSGKEPSSMMVGQRETEMPFNENKRSQMYFNEHKSRTFSDSNSQLECKYYSMPGGCKFGASCKYAHKEKSEASVELNFLGLPMRPGQRECTYYMTTGSCMYSVNCRFHHPDPTAVGGQDPSSGYQNGGAPQQHASLAQLPMTSWPLQQNSTEPVPYLDTSSSYLAGYYLPPQGFHPNPEWNGYQAPVNPLFPTEMSMQYPPPNSTRKDTTRRGNVSIPRPLPDGDYPERPGQPECQFFMKTGSCKFKSACKYHHPKSCIPKSPVIDLSPVGLPLRPDQPVCSNYSRHGICKYGRSCKYNHPTDCNPSASQATDAESNQDKSSTLSQEVKTEGSANPVQESKW